MTKLDKGGLIILTRLGGVIPYGKSTIRSKFSFSYGFSWRERSRHGTFWFIDSISAPADVLFASFSLNPLITYLFTANLHVTFGVISLHLLGLVYVGMGTTSLQHGRTDHAISPLLPYLRLLYGVFGSLEIR